MSDKYTATWVSHSSINDFLNCPRSYFLNNVYKDPNTNHKISIISPPLALGQIVHEVVEALSVLPVKDRFKEPLMSTYNKAWDKVAGEKGGFSSADQEEKYKKRGADMIRRVINNPGPVGRLAVKIGQDLPHYWLSEQDNIILCGKIDWLEYKKDSDSVEIVDFKTSKKEEREDSLQLPIYYLLAKNTQNRPVTGLNYWYLEFENEPKSLPIPDENFAHDKILKIAKDIKLARSLERFKCPGGMSGCRYCKPLETVIAGDAKLVGTNDYGQDLYVVESVYSTESKIL